ncbi:hypothetical protein KDRO_B07600 [Kluyveromyces lactis]|nr:hypothetical protein KDRO_B07600 [Kluyveromyces lactis]
MPLIALSTKIFHTNKRPPLNSMTEFSKRLRLLYRGTITQAVIIGLLSFTQPGVWSAIAGLGAGGLQTVGTANASSAILFGIMFVFSPIFGILINKWGVRPVITIGTIGYVFWSAGLYKNSKDGSQPLILAGAALCGISAAAFWTGEATVAILYPEQQQRGLFIGIWQGINKIGGLIAGAVTLALNVDGNTTGSVSLNTYIGLMVIQCLGLPISFLLSPPEKLIRKNGSKLKPSITGKSLKEEIKTFLNVLRRKEVVGLSPLFLSVVWFNTWQSNYMTHHFTVRVRALNSLLSALIPGLTDIAAGLLLDTNVVRRSMKVKISWAICVLLMSAFFVYSLIIQNEFDKTPEEGIDWTGNSRFAKSFIPFQVFKISCELIFNWVYWVVGTYQFSSEEISYVSATIRSIESLGQTFAFVIGTVNSSDMTNLAVSAGAFFLSVIPVTYVVSLANDEEIHGIVQDSEEEDQQIDEVESDHPYGPLKDKVIVLTRKASE